MTRASTTPSIFSTSTLIAWAILSATFWSFPVTRMEIGVDRPSFMAERTMPPASNANSRSLKLVSRAKAVRRIWTYSWADFDRSSESWILTTASIGPAFSV